MRTLEEEMKVLLDQGLPLNEKIIVKDSNATLGGTIDYILHSDDTVEFRKRLVNKVTNRMYFLLPE